MLYNIVYLEKLMKAFAVALLGVGFIPSAIAGPYVSTKTEFKGNEDGYSKMVNQARIGTTFKVCLLYTSDAADE